MESLYLLGQGFISAMGLHHFWWRLVGVVLGTVVGKL